MREGQRTDGFVEELGGLALSLRAIRTDVPVDYFQDPAHRMTPFTTTFRTSHNRTPFKLAGPV